MGHKDISLPERRRLREKKYKKHGLANILTHWFNVAAWLMLLPTGIAILSSARLGLSPLWWQELFRNALGSTANLIRFHYTIGLGWVAILTFNIIIGFRKYFVPNGIKSLVLDSDDIEWLKIKPLQMFWLMKDKELPPQDAYNAGQKAYMYFVILATVGIMASGIIMTFNTIFPPWLKQIAQPIHWLSVFTIVAWLFIHVYMGAVFPEEKEAFFSMFSGKVSAWYAKAHHEKWYNQKLKEEMEWEDQVRREVAESEAAHATPAEVEHSPAD